MTAVSGLGLLKRGPIKAWRYLIGRHRHRGSPLSSKRNRDVKIVAEKYPQP